MTTFTKGLAVPGSPATLETGDVLVVGRRPQRSAVSDADLSEMEVVVAAFLRLAPERGTVQSEVAG